MPSTRHLDTDSADLLPPHEQPWLQPGIAGIDEVGIGPLAGPVVAAAVILHPQQTIAGLDDSKKLTHKRRLAVAEVIRREALCWALGWANEAEIDAHNILRASHLAMQRACADLRDRPRAAYVDGNKTPNLGLPCVAVVKGDQLVPAISAASILAKVARDEYMCRLDEQLPGYDFARHKGYPTPAHLQALQRLGVSPAHRRSFAPVRARMEATS